ncbi:MAG: hypothetical protein ACI9Y7_002876 [Dokdonia sp.]|jgi:hypothetical protein
MQKRILSIVIALASLAIGYGQETEDTSSKDDRPIPRFRIGVKVGVPNIVGGGIEYVTPLFNNRIAPFIDYSSFNVDVDESENAINFFEIGSNIYFGDKGKGLYASLSYSRFDAESSIEGAETINGELFTGFADGEIEISTFNVKLGAKLGRKFYFRIEAGYGFGDIPKEIVVTGVVNGVAGVGIEEIPDIPGVGDSGLLIANIGFGFSF